MHHHTEEYTRTITVETDDRYCPVIVVENTLGSFELRVNPLYKQGAGVSSIRRRELVELRDRINIALGEG